jgi:hypothetical protein
MVNHKKNGKWKSAAARRLLEMAGKPATVEDAARIVASEATRDIPRPPLDLDALAKKLNAGPILYEDVPFSGELRPVSGGFVVVCSKHLSSSRRRFTIAHELSHAIIEKSGPNCPRVGPELERICDILATELLMPRSAFLERTHQGISIDQIFELARAFGTSLAATAIRCAELRNVSVFQVEDRVVAWAHGVVNKGPTRLLDSDLRRLADDGAAGGSGEADVRLMTKGFSRSWHVQYRGIKAGRVLFLLKPQSAQLSAQAS